MFMLLSSWQCHCESSPGDSVPDQLLTWASVQSLVWSDVMVCSV